MTILPQCVFLDNEHGYVITNGETDWDEMPSKENFQNPPIKLENLWRGYELEELVEHDAYDEDITGFDDFLENYKAVLRGESEVWRLIGVSILPCLIMFKVANAQTENYGTLYLSLTGYERMSYPDYVRFRLTVHDKTDECVSWHRIVIQRYDGWNQQQILLTEWDGYSKRKMDFGIYRTEDCTNFNDFATTEDQRVIFGNRSYRYQHECWPIRVKEYR